MLSLVLVVLSILGLCGVIGIKPLCIVVLVYIALDIICVILKKINH